MKLPDCQICRLKSAEPPEQPNKDAINSLLQGKDTGDTNYPPCVMPLAKIRCQVGRGKISYTIPPMWITTTMDRFPSSLAAFGFGKAVGEEE
ncbi:hypothetical protein B0H14DRAFT_1655338 [Mycena olivaceomarginata]|nr:hypothetical protein B0H14DRAFT_1655338 [Mycena olivaceomarginata]